MTSEEYYAKLKERWDKVDKSNRAEIQEYNRWKHELRQLLNEGNTR